MRTILLMLGVLVAGSGALWAQEDDGGRRRRRGGGGMTRMMAPLLVVAADADASQDVTAKEWSAFVDSARTEDGVDTAVLSRKIYSRLLDHNQNGRLEVADLQAIFEDMDKNDDGMIAEDELGNRRRRGPRGEGGDRRGGSDRRGGGDDRDGFRTQDPDDPGARRRGGREGRGGGGLRFQRAFTIAVVRNADADSSRTVTAEEWSAYLESLEAGKDGVIADAKLDGMMENRASRGMNLNRMLERSLGEDPVAKLGEAFATVDKDGDGLISKEEWPGPKKESKDSEGKGKVL